MTISQQVTAAGIRQAVRDLGLSGQPLCVHSSLRSFGRVEGGPETVINALLDEDCTLLVPTFSDAFEIAPPPDMRPERNGWDYDHDYGVPVETDDVFTPDSAVINDNMGAIPQAVLQRPNRVRGNHPLNSFSAVGHHAHQLVDGQRPDDVYAPLREIAARDGYVVLMGVGLDCMTALHMAEHLAGRNLFKRWALDNNRQPMFADIGSCSQGFSNLDSALASLERRTIVGNSDWRVYPLQKTVDAAAAAIRENPEITRCSDPSCRICSDAIAGGPIL